MTDIPTQFALAQTGQADEKAVVRGPAVRFTVLTPRLLRLEYDPQERFVDRASQVFWYRQQPVPPFTAQARDDEIVIDTGPLLLRYRPHPSGFSGGGLSIQMQESGVTWSYGDVDKHNLKGTLRTLDLTSGAGKLEPGLLSRTGWTVIDDSDTLLFDEAGWLQPRGNGDQALDLYFCGYGGNYQRCLDDFFRIAGGVPLLPRWALGNWWSRYWAYTQEAFTELMRSFRDHGIPLAVAIIDMDWHLTATGNRASGWTGYTWNRALFPDPPALLHWLHTQGLKTALNLHPAEGVFPHEDAYPVVARHMGIDPATEEPIPFALADPRFAVAYFQHLHHPREIEGVDFWWIDWQQGTASGMSGLDPLWWLNHLHYYDRTRDGHTRGFIFSRWGGLGNHRYPIGFSGDTYVDWPSLAFQPYQTATAANVGYGWWSHDIGGHMQGIEEAELYTRWVQFGIFSPIMRLHSTKNPYHERRPWGYDAETYRVAAAALQLRHALIPYLYSMSWRYWQENIAPIRPLYHLHPEAEAAYHCPDEYTFGSELLVAPYVEPADGDTRLSRQVVWLPPGDWFHFFDGQHHEGDAWYARHGGLEDIPVYARAGAIVPLGPPMRWGGVDKPDALDLVVFPGADNRFDLYEDDGETLAYRQGTYALTPFTQTWQEDRLVLTVEPVEGAHDQAPAQRTYTLIVRGVWEPSSVSASVNGQAQTVRMRYDATTFSARLTPLTIGPGDRLQVELGRDGGLLARPDPRPAQLRRMVEAFRLQTSAKATIVAQAAEICADPELLASVAPELTASHRRALLETITGAGFLHHAHSGEELLVLWNNDEDPRVTYRLSQVHRRLWEPQDRFRAERGSLPRFRALTPATSLPGVKWELAVQYGDLLTLTEHSLNERGA